MIVALAAVVLATAGAMAQDRGLPGGVTDSQKAGDRPPSNASEPTGTPVSR